LVIDQQTIALPATSARIAIGIATHRRPDLLAQTLARIAEQTCRPEHVVVCGTSAEDFGERQEGVQYLISQPGLPRQRNRIVDVVRNCEVLLFLDDDFLMAPGYVEATLAAFDEHPAIVASTGDLIADGTRGPGYSVDEAMAMIAEDCHLHPPGFEVASQGYGCNLAIRMQTVRDHGILFDERLPLYGWSEDVDCTCRLARHGVIAKLPKARGVHLGTKSGRTSGLRLGYSQVANPIYLYVKGSYSLKRTLHSVGRNMAMNLARAVWSEPFIDRRGRLIGNARALADLATGRLAPERILRL
jgi:GT2 family glycosyltransferase